MDERIQTLLDESSKMTKEELIRQLHEIFGAKTSEIDKWYAIGNDFWLRRTTVNNYLCVQVFPVMEDSFLCYLQILDIGAYDRRSAERYKANVTEIPVHLPSDIRYLYPVAFSLDTDSANEMFLASTSDDKNAWLNKMGIK